MRRSRCRCRQAAAGVVGAWLLIAQLWSIVLPVLLAVIIATVLWPPAAWLRRHRWPPALAAGASVLALVSLVDAVLIGGGLLGLGVPLALPLAVLTFLGGFIPIVGAVVAGAVAVLVALVGNGFTTALIVLLVVVAVQQIEGNVLQPFLQAHSLGLHAAVVLLAVTAGSTLYGIAGAFLAVPAAASVGVVVRYLGERIDARVPGPELEPGPA